MSLRSATRKMGAVMRRDWLGASRRPAAFVFRTGTIVAEVAGFYFFAQAVGAHFRPDGLAYYPFLLLGVAVISFYVSGMNEFVSMMKEAQVAGTLEVVLNTSTSGAALLALSAFSVYSGRILQLVAFLTVGAVPFARGLHPNWPAVLLIFVLSVAVAVSLAMLAAAAQVWLQRGDAVVRLFAVVGWLFTGMAFPLSGLPAGLRQVASLVPLTYSIQGLRAALLQDGTWHPVGRPLAMLGLAGAILLPLSAAVFARVVQRARMQGTLSFY